VRFVRRAKNRKLERNQIRTTTIKQTQSGGQKCPPFFADTTAAADFMKDDSINTYSPDGQLLKQVNGSITTEFICATAAL
jgi:hypothetical protein